MLLLHEELPNILEEIDARVQDFEGITIQICFNILEDPLSDEERPRYLYSRCTHVQLDRVQEIIDKMREIT